MGQKLRSEVSYYSDPWQIFLALLYFQENLSFMTVGNTSLPAFGVQSKLCFHQVYSIILQFCTCLWSTKWNMEGWLCTNWDACKSKLLWVILRHYPGICLEQQRKTVPCSVTITSCMLEFKLGIWRIWTRHVSAVLLYLVVKLTITPINQSFSFIFHGLGPLLITIQR